MSRLIDADELHKVKFHPLPYTHITPTDVDAESYKRGWNDAIDAIMSESPTIEERKKGKWKRAYLDHEAMGERPNILYCSICNQCIAYQTNYCPNCGSYNGGET